MANEMIGNIAAESADTAAPVISGGLGNNSQEVQARLAEMQRLKTGEIFKTGLMGAAAGAQAGQGSINPLAAFVQGMASGLQAPAQVYAQKQKQIESAMGATPFGVLVPESMNPDSPYNILSGLPYELAVKAIAGIAQDSAKATKESQLRMEEKEREALTPKIDYKSEQDMATDFNKLPEVTEYKAVKSAHNQIATAQLKIWDDKTKTYLPNPAGQLAVVSGYIKLLNPQARFTEGTISAADVGSDVDKYTIDLYNRIKTGNVAGDDEVKRIQGAARAKYKAVTRNYRKVADIWGDKADARGLDSNFVLSGDTGSGETIDDVFATIKAQHPGMNDREIFAIMKSQGY